jgi:hypothetical protein
MFQPRPAHEPPDDVLDQATGTHEPHLHELLTICEHFLRTASPTVHNELREFLTADLDHHPTAGLPAFLDELQFTTTRPPDQPGGAK